MRLYYLLSGLLGLLLSGYQVAAQTTPDSTHVSYEEEVVAQPLRTDSTGPVLRVQREVQGQWKLGLNNFRFGTVSYGEDNDSEDYNRYGVHVAYERKLGPAWAVQGEVSPAMVRYNQTAFRWRWAPSVQVQLMGRYYYNLERRIRKGKRQGTFTGNYLALAVGAGLGRHTYETPFYYSPPAIGESNHGLVDVALLYGIQRRLGRRGFIDANVGLAQLVVPENSGINLRASMRIGLLLGSPPPVEKLSMRLGVADDAQLRPRYYVGTQFGVYTYRVHFSGVDILGSRPGSVPSSLRRPGVGAYSVDITKPSFYAGYQLWPRLALQLGYQGQAATTTATGTAYLSGGAVQVDYKNTLYAQTLAFPLLARYNLTRQYKQRMQFDVLGGVTLVHARVHNEETRYRNGQEMDVYSLKRQSTGAHLIGGGNISYGIGRQRKLQLTGEFVLIQNIHSSVKGLSSIKSGSSLGVRYRFGPRF